MYRFPVYQPSLRGNERKYLNDCIDTNWLTWQGQYIKRFEKKFANYIGVEYSSTTSNGTVALHLALLALGVGIDDEVIVPTLTYIASANAVVYCGAKPVFCDVDPVTWQLDPLEVRKKITPHTKAIMAVHVYGHPCEMDELKDIAIEFNLAIVEDCAESFGSKFKGRYTGTIGDIGVFSFFGNKTITTGEGGMVVTNKKTLIDRVNLLKGQGLARHREYWHEVIGFNYRMTNIAAAIGLAQLERADEILEKKQQIARWYLDLLADLPLSFQLETGDVLHSYWMFSILTDDAKSRDLLRHYLKSNGIETRPVFHPIHTMPMYCDNFQQLKIAEDIGWRGINLPSYPDLTEEDVNEISKIIHQYYKQYKWNLTFTTSKVQDGKPHLI
ncbi:MAG TPA: DegT/DnrJ/EryC1/StrS family aminotransferase [Lentimicrobium sp.]|nr:DegT/DnrJ/EryC1/StrS family aminotransferase [Lentimicrobium sp.]